MKGMWGILLICSASLSLAAAPGRKQVIAHRGASGYAPEHTRAAYLLAVQQGADFVEQDLGLGKDGQLICLHDVCHEALDGARFHPCGNQAARGVELAPLVMDVLRQNGIDTGARAILQSFDETTPRALAFLMIVEARPEVVNWALFTDNPDDFRPNDLSSA